MPLKTDYLTGDPFPASDHNAENTQINQNTDDIAALDTAVDGKVDENPAITGATRTKITYDAKGLVTAGANATQDDIGDGTTYKQFSGTEKSKLAGIAVGATANDTDANLKNRANHTGTQAISTVTGTLAQLNTVVTDAELVQGSSNGTPMSLTLWKGTQAQYDALGSWDSATVYVVTP